MNHRGQVGTPLAVAAATLLTVVVPGACKPPPQPREALPATVAPALRPSVQPEFAAVNDPDLVKLKEALREGTAEALIPYFEHPEAMAPGGELSSYDAAYLRGLRQGGSSPLKPVRQILKEPVAVLATSQPKGDWIVVFIPEAKRYALDDSGFLETGWLTDYFACRVDRRGGKLRIVHNFCFNETDGPFPGDA